MSGGFGGTSGIFIQLRDGAVRAGRDTDPTVAAAVSFQVRGLAGVDLDDGFRPAGFGSRAVLARLAEIRIDVQ